jgi:hypothetical protein
MYDVEVGAGRDSLLECSMDICSPPAFVSETAPSRAPNPTTDAPDVAVVQM